MKPKTKPRYIGTGFLDDVKGTNVGDTYFNPDFGGQIWDGQKWVVDPPKR